MPKENILVVEDEEDILDIIRITLTREGYRVTGVTSGEEALRSVLSRAPDLVLLDLMLPGISGLEVCRRIKGDPRTASIPVIMVTARGEETDIVTGLELGADDYIPKPFSNRVLVARIHAVIRRKKETAVDPNTPIRIHDLTIHPGRHEVICRQERIELTATEFRLLGVLARRPGWVMTRDQIVNAVKGEDYPVTERSVDVQIVGLRRKLGKRGAYIETVRGVGYRFSETP
ncbi:MAG: DNA-binding response regulator [Lentisphaerae bacterium RIFOXYC12_FULL_60_16]|nr:MAG: DNA-binding response regulator [Lentisphaerae bacterium RIFOXYC12_FULL_60_16]OGV84359.1 MAG: DNA-binding response regulator [Lentisphaerae bacterium RIFOXYB12_FULL_60_10]